MRTGCAKSFGSCGYARRSAATTLPSRVSISTRSTSVVTTTCGDEVDDVDALVGVLAAPGTPVALGISAELAAGGFAVDGVVSPGLVAAIGGADVSPAWL